MFRRLLSANLLRSIHQQQQQPKRTMKVVVDKILADNYMYYVIDSQTKEAFVVDLGDASKIGNLF